MHLLWINIINLGKNRTLVIYIVSLLLMLIELLNAYTAHYFAV